jgi:hypothetical protein
MTYTQQLGAVCAARAPRRARPAHAGGRVRGGGWLAAAGRARRLHTIVRSSTGPCRRSTGAAIHAADCACMGPCIHRTAAAAAAAITHAATHAHVCTRTRTSCHRAGGPRPPRIGPPPCTAAARLLCV